jgi:hypothetical protein
MAEATAAPAANTTAAPEAAAATIPAANTEATETLKVNGKEIKVTKAQLIAAAQKGYFADQRIKSADVLKGKTEALINALKTPDGLLQILKDPALGASPKEVFRKLMSSDVVDDDLKEEMSQWVYKNVVQTAKLTPEQLEERKKLSEYERLKKAEDDRKTQDMTKAQTAKVEGIRKAVVAEVSKQLQATKDFPQTEGSIRAVVEKLRVMNKNGAGVTVENVAKAIGLVKKEYLVQQQAMFDTLEDPEKLIEMFGEARALKISKALVARLQAKGKVKPVTDGETTGEKIQKQIAKKLGRNEQGYTIVGY